MRRLNYPALLLTPLLLLSFSSCVFLIPIAEYEQSAERDLGGYGDPRYAGYEGDTPKAPYRRSVKRSRFASQLRSLIDNLHSEDDVVRVHAATDLGALGKAASPAVPTLSAVVLQDSSKWVRRSAVKALARIGDRRGIPALERASRDRDRYVAHSANRALRRLRARL